MRQVRSEASPSGVVHVGNGWIFGIAIEDLDPGIDDWQQWRCVDGILQPLATRWTFSIVTASLDFDTYSAFVRDCQCPGRMLPESGPRWMGCNRLEPDLLELSRCTFLHTLRSDGRSVYLSGCPLRPGRC